MALRNFFRRQLRTVIEWANQSPDILFFQFQALTDEIKNTSKLIVNPGQGCILVYEGKVIDVLTEPGTYQLSTANHPFVTNLLKMMQSFESEHKMKFYFFRSADLVDQKWGTSSPIKYMDSVYQFPIELGAYGTYSIRIDDANQFFTKIVGSKPSYTANELRQLMVSRIIPTITTNLANQRYSYQNIDTQLVNIAADTKNILCPIFSELGLNLTDFRIEATSFNDETVARINKIADSRSEALAAEQVGLSYVENEKLKALRDAAKNEGGLAGAGLQIGAGFELAKSFDLNNKNGSSIENPDNEMINQLKKLKSLLDDGILTQEEFTAKKKQILERL